MKLREFLEFVREQGVVGLTVGFILGGSVSGVVSSLVQDIINPLIGLLVGGGANELKTFSFTIAGSQFKWGNFAAALLNFIIMAFIVYYVVKGFKIDRIDKKKQ